MLDYIVTAAPAVGEQISYLAQAVPGEGAGSEAPPGFEGIGNRIISGAKWIGLLLAIIGAIAAFAGAAISRNRGNSEEATERFVTIALAVAGIMGVVSIISWIIEASGAA